MTITKEALMKMSKHEALELIAKASKNGMSPQMSLLLDAVLGTEVESLVDKDSEEAAFLAMQAKIES